MKIGILTFHASHNYGSMLLAYALQEALKEDGHQVKIINHRIYAQNMMYANPMKFTHKIFIKNFFTHPLFFISDAKKWKRFEKFSQEYHNLTRQCPTLVDVENVIKEEQFDAVISGGDQIWNMQCSDFSLAYYLPFDIPNVRKIAYSPSFGGGGVYKFSNYSKSIVGLLRDYDFISVREKSSSEYFSGLLNTSIPSVCDPTLLVPTSKYMSLIGNKRIIKEKYIFYYSPFSTKDTEKIALKLGQEYGLPIYTSNGQPSQSNGLKRFQIVGPIEFLNLIQNSEMVCGNSFHLVVFSILFHKKFLILSKSDNRMESFLEDLGLSGHFCSSVNELDNIEVPNINWALVEEKINILMRQGKEFLINALKI